MAIDLSVRLIHIERMQPLPVTIRKHWFGYVVIALAGLLLISALWVGLFSLWQAGQLSQELYWAIGGFSIIILLITLIQMYVYSLSYLELNDDGIVVKNWITLFVSTDEEFEWVRVSRASVLKGEIFAQLLNYGTLSIETDGGHVLVTIKMIPRIEYWQNVISERADLATQDGTDTP